jgi:hypothetical protein
MVLIAISIKFHLTTIKLKLLSNYLGITIRPLKICYYE